jgi:hypothetical protein
MFRRNSTASSNSEQTSASTVVSTMYQPRAAGMAAAMKAIPSSVLQLLSNARKSHLMRFFVVTLIWMLVWHPVWWLATLIIAIEAFWLLSLTHPNKE